MPDMTISKQRDVSSEEYGDLRKALTLIAGKWKLEILWRLYHRTHRFGELMKAIPGVTQHMLTRQLRELETDGLVTRRVFAEVPPRVEYSMTEATKALEPTIQSLIMRTATSGGEAGRRAVWPAIGCRALRARRREYQAADVTADQRD